MTLVVGWVLLPLVLGLLSLGCGLLVETVSGTRIPGALLLPLGFALVVVATPFAALSPSTASLAAPIFASPPAYSTCSSTEGLTLAFCPRTTGFRARTGAYSLLRGYRWR